jgi:hypothetical protein
MSHAESDKTGADAGELARREQVIRERAHQLWETDGRPEGRAEQYWHRAQELIDDEAERSYPPSQSQGNRN